MIKKLKNFLLKSGVLTGLGFAKPTNNVEKIETASEIYWRRVYLLTSMFNKCVDPQQRNMWYWKTVQHMQKLEEVEKK